MTYDALIATLKKRGLFRILPGLSRTRAVLRALGNPQDELPAIDIAGTNGKGSVAAGIESVLRKAGYRTGLYISPHLHEVTERIQIGAQAVSRTDFSELARLVREAEISTQTKLTYFEFTTVMAFLAFSRAKVDLAIVECGLGGLWDSTNVITHPLVSIITSVGFDHMQWLGTTEAEIALQKAGIIKQGCPVISGVRGPGKSVIAATARTQNAPLRQLDHDFQVWPRTMHWTEHQQSFRYQSTGEAAEDFRVSLAGAHQAENAGLVIRTAMELRALGWKIDSEDLHHGLEEIRWPGRFQVISMDNGSRVIFDGAHNTPAMHRFLRTLEHTAFRNTRKRFLFSAFKDKDYRAMASMIMPVAHDIVLTRLPGPRGVPLKSLASAFKAFRGRIQSFQNPESAYQAAQTGLHPGDTLVVTGSLALVGPLLSRVTSSKEICHV